MLYLYIFLLTSLSVLLYMRIETTLLEVKRIYFTKSSKALKVMQLSDVHINRLYVSFDKIKQSIARENPDIIIITGDYIESKSHIPRFISFLNYLDIKDNVYLCLGNHDFEAYKKDKPGLSRFIEAIEATGAKLLHNECVNISKGSNTYNLIGIADMRYGHHDIGKALRNCKQNALVNIGFSHNPDIVLEIPQGKLDYLFCGHFHGGQIWMPFDFEFKLLRKEKLCKQGVKSGLHKINGINLYINRGLGNVSLPLRFLSRPEITIFHIP